MSYYIDLFGSVDGIVLRRRAVGTPPTLPLVAPGSLVGLNASRPCHGMLVLLRRISTLSDRYKRAPFDFDYHKRKQRAGAARFAAAELRWGESARWSGRQISFLQLGGLRDALLSLFTCHELFWPLLALTSWVHVGKGTTMGLGAVRGDPA